MALDTLLIGILACPIDKGTLLYFEDDDILYNPRTKTAYEVNDGIPVLLPDTGRVVDAKEDKRLMAKKASAVETGANSPS